MNPNLRWTMPTHPRTEPNLPKTRPTHPRTEPNLPRTRPTHPSSPYRPLRMSGTRKAASCCASCAWDTPRRFPVAMSLCRNDWWPPTHSFRSRDRTGHRHRLIRTLGAEHCQHVSRIPHLQGRIGAVRLGDDSRYPGPSTNQVFISPLPLTSIVPRDSQTNSSLIRSWVAAVIWM